MTLWDAQACGWPGKDNILSCHNPNDASDGWELNLMQRTGETIQVQGLSFTLPTSLELPQASIWRVNLSFLAPKYMVFLNHPIPNTVGAHVHWPDTISVGQGQWLSIQNALTSEASCCVLKLSCFSQVTKARKFHDSTSMVKHSSGTSDQSSENLATVFTLISRRKLQKQWNGGDL